MHLLTLITQLMDETLSKTLRNYTQKDLFFRMRLLSMPYFYPGRTSRDSSEPESNKVLDNDSSKFLLFFTSSSFNLSRQQLIVYQTAKVDEIQLVQKGVVQSWLGPLK